MSKDIRADRKYPTSSLEDRTNLYTAWGVRTEQPPLFDEEQIFIHEWGTADPEEFKAAIGKEMNLQDIKELMDSCLDAARGHEKRAKMAMKLRDRIAAELVRDPRNEEEKDGWGDESETDSGDLDE